MIPAGLYLKKSCSPLQRTRIASSLRPRTCRYQPCLLCLLPTSTGSGFEGPQAEGGRAENLSSSNHTKGLGSLFQRQTLLAMFPGTLQKAGRRAQGLSRPNSCTGVRLGPLPEDCGSTFTVSSSSTGPPRMMKMCSEILTALVSLFHFTVCASVSH